MEKDFVWWVIKLKVGVPRELLLNDFDGDRAFVEGLDYSGDLPEGFKIAWVAANPKEKDQHGFDYYEMTVLLGIPDTDPDAHKNLYAVAYRFSDKLPRGVYVRWTEEPKEAELSRGRLPTPASFRNNPWAMHNRKNRGW